MRRPRIRGRKQTAKQLINAKILFGNSSINALASENAFARECSPLWKGAAMDGKELFAAASWSRLAFKTKPDLVIEDLPT